MPSVYGIMVATNAKRTEAVDIKGPLLAYVSNTYGSKQAEEISEDLATVQQLRTEIALVSANAMTPGMRDSLTKYYRILTSIENRFPISKDKGHASVTFAWMDAFRPKNRVAQSNIHFEKAAVLFNLGAVLNQAALGCDRTTADGLQQACKLFQEAAGAFSFLLEAEASKVDSPRPQDLIPEAISTMEKLMLAQAQECVYLKSVLDKKAPNTISRLAKQTALMYADVERCFNNSAVSSYFDRSWLSHTQLKASAYEVEAMAQFAKGLHVEDKVAPEIAILKEAYIKVELTAKLAKAVSPDMVDSVARVREAVMTTLSKAEKENNSIYLDKVPAFADAGYNVQGALLVKSVRPASLEGGVDNMFHSLVPDSSAKALSRYSELVDGVMRTQRDALAAATDTARIKLKEWELPETLELLDPRSSPNSLAASCLPPALLAELEEVERVGGVKHLTEILAEIGEVRKGVESDLAAASTALESDANEDNEMRAKFGDAVRMPPSATACKPYWDKLAQYRKSMADAANSDMGVMKRMHDHDAAFKDLTIDQTALKMPRLQAPLVAVGPEDPVQVVGAIRRDLESLQAQANERNGIEEALKDLKNKDNILPKVMSANAQMHNALFTAELKKYDGIAEDIKRNAEAQERVLASLDIHNRAFRQVFDINGWRAACNKAAVGTRAEVAAFRELLDHCSEGLRFYLGIAEVVRRYRQECEDWVYTRKVQRDEVRMDFERRKRHEEDEQLARRMHMAGLGPGSNTPPPPAGHTYPVTPGNAAASAPPPPPPPSRPSYPGGPPQAPYHPPSPPPAVITAAGGPPPPPPPAAGQFGRPSSSSGANMSPQSSFTSSVGAPPQSQPPPQYGYGYHPHGYSQPPPQYYGGPPPPPPAQHYAPQAGYPPQGYVAPPPGYPYGTPPQAHQQPYHPQPGQQYYNYQ